MEAGTKGSWPKALFPLVKRIYLIVDSKQKWSKLRAKTKLIGSVCLKVVNNFTTKNK
jgi:hypothetical protein